MENVNFWIRTNHREPGSTTGRQDFGLVSSPQGDACGPSLTLTCGCPFSNKDRMEENMKRKQPIRSLEKGRPSGNHRPLRALAKVKSNEDLTPGGGSSNSLSLGG